LRSLICGKSGTLEALDIPRSFSPNAFFRPIRRVGDEIVASGDYRCRVGAVIATGSCPAEAVNAANRYIEACRVVVRANPS
jgi:hypothetical protein